MKISTLFQTIFFIISGCSGTGFMGNTKSVSPKNKASPHQNPSPAAPETQPVVAQQSGDGKTVNAENLQCAPNTLSKEQFVFEERPLLDVVWVVDNTGSMESYQKKVALNLLSFLKAVEKRNDVQVALITAERSDPGGGFPRYGMALPPEVQAKSGKQLDIAVGNHTALAVAMSALCPAALTDENQVCGVARSAWTPFRNADDALKSDSPEFKATDAKFSYVLKAKGGLNQWVRPAAKKIISFVSNDNIKGFHWPQYQLAAKNIPGGKGFDRFFSFIHKDSNCLAEKEPGMVSGMFSDTIARACASESDIKNPTPNVGCHRYEIGTNFLSFLKEPNSMFASQDSKTDKLDGKAYSICKDDWSEYFNEMVSSLTERVFILKKPVQKLDNAFIDGKVIDVSSVKLDGNKLIIPESIIPDFGRNLTVEYGMSSCNKK